MTTTTRPTAGSIETRTAADLLTTDERKIRGVVPFGVESRDLGGWREIIEPTALHGAKLDDLVVTVDHAGVPLGRYPGDARARGPRRRLALVRQPAREPRRRSRSRRARRSQGRLVADAR